jgi:hypothetical protein
VAQGVGPEFKPQCHEKKKKNWFQLDFLCILQKQQHAWMIWGFFRAKRLRYQSKEACLLRIMEYGILAGNRENGEDQYLWKGVQHLGRTDDV